MTRSFFKGLTIRAVIAVFLSLLFLFGCLMYSKKAQGAREQERYKEEFGSLLMASEYRLLNTEILNGHKDITAVYSAFDESGKLIGYVIDVATTTTNGYIHTQMSISENGENLLNIRVVEEEGSITFTEEEMEEMRNQLKGARIPVALNQTTSADISYQVEYDPLLGLHDGIYYAEREEVSSDGYKDYCEIQVSGGRIVSVTWDGENAKTHNTRSQDSISGDYKVSGNMWADQAYRLSNYLVLVQDPMKLAMKSDGTTQIVEGVTINISTFVELVNECISNSRSSFTKEMYMQSLQDGDDEDKDKDTKEPEVTPDPQEEVTPVPATPIPSPTRPPQEIGVIGGEDGVVQGETGSILSESIDGIPMSEIRTMIIGIPGENKKCEACLTTVNLAYKFMREYLNWVG
ncbi:MAG: hypothetical protein J6Y08_08465 [Clostridiales bacterium]|nr:hypothetical protein [Clostridiales bacterium]